MCQAHPVLKKAGQMYGPFLFKFFIGSWRLPPCPGAQGGFVGDPTLPACENMYAIRYSRINIYLPIPLVSVSTTPIATMPHPVGMSCIASLTAASVLLTSLSIFSY